MDIPANAKYAIIRETSQRTDNLLGIKQLCSLAGVSRSGYYRYLSTEDERRHREQQDQEDFQRIMEAYQFRGYAKGARGIYMRLIHMEPPVVMNIKKIRRLEWGSMIMTSRPCFRAYRTVAPVPLRCRFGRPIKKKSGMAVYVVVALLS